MDIQRIIPTFGIIPSRVEAKQTPRNPMPVPPDGQSYLGVFVPDTSLMGYNAGQRFFGADVPLQYDTVYADPYYRARCAVTPQWKFMQALNEYQGSTGKKAAVVMGFQPFYNEGIRKWQDFPLSFCKAVYNNECNAGKGLERSVPMITWEPWTFPGRDHSKFLLEEIIDAIDSEKGALYEYMRKWAEDARDFGNPIMLRTMHEMNCDNYPWRGFANGGDADKVSLVDKDDKGNYFLLGAEKKSLTKGNGIADGPERYIAAWLKIRELFKKVEATNVSFVWCANNEGRPNSSEINSNMEWNSIGSYYPGDENVDWVGFDGYKRDNVQGFDGVFAEVKRFIRDYRPQKPLAFCEIGSTPEATRDAFFAAAFAYARDPEHPFKLFTLFNINKEHPWNIFSTVWAYDETTTPEKDELEYQRHFRTWEVYRASAATSTSYLGATVPITIDPRNLQSPETARLVREADWDESLEIAKKDFNLYSDRITTSDRWMAKKTPEVRYQVICISIEAYEKLLSLYDRVGGTTFKMSKEDFDKKKVDLFLKLLGQLSSIPKASPFYLQALDKMKNFMYSWAPETSVNVGDGAVKVDYGSAEIRAIFSFIATEQKDASGNVTYIYPKMRLGTIMIESPLYGVCQEIINKASDPEYRRMAGYTEADACGLIATALNREAILLLDNYHGGLAAGYFSVNDKEIIMKDVIKLVAKARGYSLKKQRLLSFMDKFYPIDYKKRFEVTDFYLNNELNLIEVAVKVEMDPRKYAEDAKRLYIRLINNRDLGNDLKLRVKKAFARLLELQGESASTLEEKKVFYSRALAMWNEIVNMDDKDRRSADENRIRLQKAWALQPDPNKYLLSY